MKKIILSSMLLFFLLAGCKKDRDDVRPSSSQSSASGTSAEFDHHGDPSCPASVFDLYAGQHILIGDVTVSNDQENIYVSFNTKDGWAVKHTHLYVGPRGDMPVNSSGNPRIGHFPNSTPHDPAVANYTYTIPRSSLPADECIVIAAHAEAVLLGDNGEVKQAETAWSAGSPISDGGSWATYSDYCICESSNDDSGSNDGTGTGGSGTGSGSGSGGGSGSSDGSGSGDGGSDDDGDGDGGSGDSGSGDDGDGGITIPINH
ncbi:hypothetical protein RCC89_11635 [Cytophagaceae bacterium ABcell3]|nr:hypothetical protein RCC89_11635 [Cytophagaceae bacterium ABcell3]